MLILIGSPGLSSHMRQAFVCNGQYTSGILFYHFFHTDKTDFLGLSLSLFWAVAFFCLQEKKEKKKILSGVWFFQKKKKKEQSL